LILNASLFSDINDCRLELLKDLPDEQRWIASRIDVLPEPFFPQKKFTPGESFNFKELKHLKLLSVSSLIMSTVINNLWVH
jgi:hypothetical protein